MRVIEAKTRTCVASLSQHAQAGNDEIKHNVNYIQKIFKEAPYKGHEQFSKVKTDNKIFVDTRDFFAMLKESC